MEVPGTAYALRRSIFFNESYGAQNSCINLDLSAWSFSTFFCIPQHMLARVLKFAQHTAFFKTSRAHSSGSRWISRSAISFQASAPQLSIQFSIKTAYAVTWQWHGIPGLCSRVVFCSQGWTFSHSMARFEVWWYVFEFCGLRCKAKAHIHRFWIVLSLLPNGATKLEPNLSRSHRFVQASRNKDLILQRQA